MLKNKCIILGISGGIAAYKMANLASLLVKKGAKVHVIMTENATKFISPITFETLTKNKCMINTFDRNFEYKVEHIYLSLHRLLQILSQNLLMGLQMICLVQLH